MDGTFHGHTVKVGEHTQALKHIARSHTKTPCNKLLILLHASVAYMAALLMHASRFLPVDVVAGAIGPRVIL